MIVGKIKLFIIFSVIHFLLLTTLYFVASNIVQYVNDLDLYILKVKVLSKEGVPVKRALVYIDYVTPPEIPTIFLGKKLTNEYGEVIFTLNYKELRDYWSSFIKKLQKQKLMKFSSAIVISVIARTTNGLYIDSTNTVLVDLLNNGTTVKRVNVILEKSIYEIESIENETRINRELIANWTWSNTSIPLVYISSDRNSIKDYSQDDDTIFCHINLALREQYEFGIRMGICKIKEEVHGYEVEYEIGDFVFSKKSLAGNTKGLFIESSSQNRYRGYIYIKGSLRIRVYNVTDTLTGEKWKEYYAEILGDIDFNTLDYSYDDIPIDFKKFAREGFRGKLFRKYKGFGCYTFYENITGSPNHFREIDVYGYFLQGSELEVPALPIPAGSLALKLLKVAGETITEEMEKAMKSLSVSLCPKISNQFVMIFDFWIDAAENVNVSVCLFPTEFDYEGYKLPLFFIFIDESYEEIEFNLTLYEGWNLISFPLRPFNSSVDSIFNHPLIEAYEVHTWDPINKKYVRVDKIEPGKGYWVFVSLRDVNVINLTVKGIPIWEYNITLYEGWNMIGSVITETTLSASEDEVYTKYYVWDPVSKSYKAKEYIIPGQGAWVLSYKNTITNLTAYLP